MTKEKEIGYELTNIIHKNIKEFPKFWMQESTEKKDNIINQIGNKSFELTKNRYFEFSQWISQTHEFINNKWIHKFANYEDKENYFPTETLYQLFLKIEPNTPLTILNFKESFDTVIIETNKGKFYFNENNEMYEYINKPILKLIECYHYIEYTIVNKLINYKDNNKQTQIDKFIKRKLTKYKNNLNKRKY